MPRFPPITKRGVGETLGLERGVSWLRAGGGASGSQDTQISSPGSSWDGGLGAWTPGHLGPLPVLERERGGLYQCLPWICPLQPHPFCSPQPLIPNPEEPRRS